MKHQYAEGVTIGPAFDIYYCTDNSKPYEPLWNRAAVDLSLNGSALSLCGARICVQHMKRTLYPMEVEVNIMRLFNRLK